MHNTTKYLLAALLMGSSCAASFAADTGQNAAEPDHARWYVADTTPQARYQTSTKEAGAAYQESLAECRIMPRTEKAACTKDADANYRSDMAGASKARGR